MVVVEDLQCCVHGIWLVVVFVVLCEWYQVRSVCSAACMVPGTPRILLFPIRGNEWFLMHGNAISMVFDEHHAISIVAFCLIEIIALLCIIIYRYIVSSMIHHYVVIHVLITVRIKCPMNSIQYQLFRLQWNIEQYYGLLRLINGRLMFYTLTT